MNISAKPPITNAAEQARGARRARLQHEAEALERARKINLDLSDTDTGDQGCATVPEAWRHFE
jgi:hypothetical protein